jgi:hypothetical protein
MLHGICRREQGEGKRTVAQHNLFYYPYASFTGSQSLLLKAAALYFDKLYVLDPLKASFGQIGIGAAERDVQLLEQEQILDRVAPEEVLNKYEATITAAIKRDLNDAGFKKLCAEKIGSLWTLALAKVPEGLRHDPAFSPLEDSMKRALTGEGGYSEKAGYSEYAEYRESATGVIEYRYADYPFDVGEAIMLNHALVGGILHAGAIPITDDEIHSRILNYKLQQAQQELPEIRAALAATRLEFAGAKLAAQSLTDLDLGVIPEAMPLEKILEYRLRYSGELQAARDKLQWMAREITDEPWTKAFEDAVFHQKIPELHKALQPAQNSWSAWLKLAGLAMGGAAAVLALFTSPGAPAATAVVVAALTIGKDAGIGGLECVQDWKAGKARNGLHYLLRLKS